MSESLCTLDCSDVGFITMARETTRISQTTLMMENYTSGMWSYCTCDSMGVAIYMVGRIVHNYSLFKSTDLVD